MDLKVIPKSYKGHIFILYIIDEVTNYLITVSIYHSRLEEIGDAPNRKCYIKILHTRLYNNRPR